MVNDDALSPGPPGLSVPAEIIRDCVKTAHMFDTISSRRPRTVVFFVASS